MSVRKLNKSLLLVTSLMLLTPFIGIVSRVFGQTICPADPEINVTEVSGELEEVPTSDSEDIIKYVSEHDLRERLKTLEGCTPLRITPVVKGYLSTYLVRKPEKTLEMLAKQSMYFHIYEQELKAQNMPEDLKYLSVVESALNPVAVSRCGATGLWQFMPATGKEYGLQQNRTVDERSDPVKSTRAALKYLKHLHGQFGDWALAMAAYNSGPGNVSRAIKRARSKNFWAIQKYLPKETANYVPAFVAATYICNYYTLHNMTPQLPELDMQLTSYIKVFEGINFSTISDATGLDPVTIGALNPSYKQKYIPGEVQGSYIVLPVRVMTAFVRYLNSKSGNAYSPDFGNMTYALAEDGASGHYIQTDYYVEKSDFANKLAENYGCNKSHLSVWNALAYAYVQAGNTLKVWRPVISQSYTRLRIEAPSVNTSSHSSSANTKVNKNTAQHENTTTKPSTTPSSISEASVKESSNVEKESNTKALTAPIVEVQNSSASQVVATPAESSSVIYHTVKRNESLSSIAAFYGIPLAKLKEINPNTKISVGKRIKIYDQRSNH